MSMAGTPQHKTAQPFISPEQGPRGTAYNYTLGQGPVYGVAVVVLASTTTTTTTVPYRYGKILPQGATWRWSTFRQPTLI